jgi:hypothetical protein
LRQRHRQPVRSSAGTHAPGWRGGLFCCGGAGPLQRLARQLHHQQDRRRLSGDRQYRQRSTAYRGGNGTGEGGSALLARTNVSLGLVGCSPTNVAWTTGDYFDSSDALLGHAQTSSDYDISSSAQRNLPQVAKVGDSGVYATQQMHADSTKTGSAASAC